jgi:hypothetical protein
MCAKDLSDGRTQVLKMCQIRRIDHISSESDQDCALEIISNCDNWLNWNGDLDNPNNSEADSMADDECVIVECGGNKASVSPETHIVSSVMNISG